MNNYSLTFYAKATKGNSEFSAIYLRITINGKRSEVSTGQTIPTSSWCPKTKKVKGANAQSKALNNTLDFIKLKVLNSYNELLFSDKIITSETLKNKYLGLEEKKITLIQVFKDHNLQMKNLIGRSFSKGTWERYETSLRHTIEFMNWKYNVSDIDVRNVNPDFVSNYEFWLRTVRKCANNSAVKYIKNFQKIINICIANDWIEKNPFRNYKSKIDTVEKRFLSETDLEKIISKQFKSERLTKVKDIFIFACYTGLAYVDIKNLTNDFISFGIDGGKWIKIKRAKTKIDAKIPLLPTVELLIDKYKYDPSCLNENRPIPILSNQRMNEYLKEISEICELDFDLTFHIARHTFATTVTLNNGVPIETVSKMLGHSNIRMTQHYAKILDSKVSNDMNILKEKLSQKELKMKIS